MQNQFSWIQIELKTNPKQQEFNSLRETKSNTLLTSIAPRRLYLSCNQAGFTCIMFWRRLGEIRADESVPWVLIGQKLSWKPRNSKNLGFESLWKRRAAANSGMDNTAAKRLRMRQVEHFRSLFQSHFPVKVSRALHSVCSLWFSCSALCCSCFWLFCSYWNCFYG